MEEFFTDTILQKHAAKLLFNYKLRTLGYFAARLDFHLVEWLAKERNGAARIDNYVTALRSLYTDFSLTRPLTPIQKRSGGFFNVDRPKWVDGSSAVGDSGYMSCQDIPQTSSQFPQDGFLTGIGLYKIVDQFLILIFDVFVFTTCSLNFKMRLVLLVNLKMPCYGMKKGLKLVWTIGMLFLMLIC